MNTMCPIPSAERYWDYIKDASNDVKLNLITLLSESLQRQFDYEAFQFKDIKLMVAESLNDIKLGKVYTDEEVFTEEIQKMPWLSE